MTERTNDPDLPFKALVDSNRRKLLDLLRQHDGRTLAGLAAIPT